MPLETISISGGLSVALVGRVARQVTIHVLPNGDAVRGVRLERWDAVIKGDIICLPDSRGETWRGVPGGLNDVRLGNTFICIRPVS